MPSRLPLASTDIAGALTKNSFEWFFKLRVAPYYKAVGVDFKLGRIHREWIDTITNTTKDVCIVAARGHSKTTILSVSYPIWECHRSKTPRVIVVNSHNQEMANTILHHIKTIIRGDPVLNTTLYPFPDEPDSKWNESQIELKGGHVIYALPFGESNRGKHPDVFISDDIMRASETTNVQFVKDNFYSITYPTTQARKGRHIVIGTPVSYVDLYHELAAGKELNTFTVNKYPAVITDGSGDRPAFPELYSMEQLDNIKRTIPAHFWAREYLCQPLSGSNALFPTEKLLEAQALYRRLQPIRLDEKAGFRGSKVLGVDVAMSEAARADFSVITQVERVPGDIRMVDKLLREKGSGSKTLRDKIEALGNSGGYSRIGVEQVGLSYGLVKELCAGPLGSTIYGIKTDRKNKEAMLSRIEVLLRDGKLALPDDPVLIDELRSIAITVSPNGTQTFETLGAHDDCVMSLALALFSEESGQLSISFA